MVVLFLPVLLVGSSASDRFFAVTFLSAALAALVAAAGTGLSIGFRQALRSVRIARRPTETIAQALAARPGQIVEVRGQVGHDAPHRTLMSQTLAAASRLTVQVDWLRWSWTSSNRWKRTAWQQEHLDGVTLDDGTGRVELDLRTADRYWPQTRASWRLDRAPDWVRDLFVQLEADQAEECRRLREYGFKPRTITLTEEWLPVERELFVTGSIVGSRVLRADIASTVTEQATRRGLAAEAVLSWTIAGTAAWLLFRARGWLLDAWSVYLAGSPYLPWRLLDYGVMALLLGGTAWLAATAVRRLVQGAGHVVTRRARPAYETPSRQRE